MSKTWERGVKKLDINWGSAFYDSCIGRGKIDTAKSQSVLVGSYRNKLTNFSKVEKKEHIKFIIKCLREELKQ